MIDEELRVERAIALKLHLTDARVRMDLASAIAEAATAAVGQEAADDASLRAFFEQRRPFFQQRGPLRVRRIWVGIVAGNLGEAFNRARAAVKMLRERQDFEIVHQVCGDRDPQPIPDRLMSPRELTPYLQGMVLNVTLGLAAGEVSDPIRAADGFHVVQLLERAPLDAFTFEEARLDVEATFWAERARAALEAQAAELRRDARIQKAESF